MNYRINLGAWRRVFAVPACVADSLKIASGDQLKVLLYLLANADMGIRPQDIANAVGVTEYDVEDAVTFWKDTAGILTGSDDELVPSDKERPVQPVRVPAPVSVIPAAVTAGNTPGSDESIIQARAVLTSDTQFPPEEIANAINNDEAVRYLFELYERLAGRPTKHAERNVLMVLIEEIGLRCDVAAMLIQYCFSVDKAKPSYMKAVALDWIEAGVDSIAKAEERIKTLKSTYTLESALRKKFEMTTAFSAKQKEIIERWAAVSVPEGLIDEAYDSCLRNTGKLSFPYMDKAITSWLAEGITDVSRIKRMADKKTDAASDNNSSFDLNDLEALMYSQYDSDDTQ